MKLLLDERAQKEVLFELGLSASPGERVVIRGLRCVHLPNKIFYFERTADDSPQEFLTAELPDESIWELDKFQTAIGLKKQFVTISGEQIVPSGEKICFLYQKRPDDIDLSDYPDVTAIRACNDRRLQLGKCDIYLLIPGKLNKGKDVWENLPGMESEVFSIFRSHIDQCVEEEYNSAFVKDLERKCLGEITLEIDDLTDHHLYRQHAIAGMVMHHTGFCILEILVQNCSIGGNKLLNYYCDGSLKFIYQNETLDLPSLMQKIQLRKFGKKRSMVFLYEDAEKQEIINALANEEFPMGKIGGDFARKLECENIAQYDTAEVYVSQETMLEKCREINVVGDERLAYHAIEIFFVELILFQDASIDKVYLDLRNEGTRQQSYQDIQEATKHYEQIRFDMVQAIHFSDYEQFKFSTVRESAKKVAKCFGIDYVFEKYEVNKELLTSMISANKRKIQARQDTIKNQFLLLISALAIVGTLGEILYVVYQDQKGGLMCYVAAAVIVVIGFGLYKIIEAIFNLVGRRLKNRKTTQGE